jgi:hypothetical protein
MSLSRFLATALLLAFLASTSKMSAQTENASVAGRVTDSSGAVVPKAEVQLQNVERVTSEQAFTNDNGLYVFQSVPPGQYRLIVRKEGFRQVDYVGLIVNVQDHVDENFKLQVGSISESITVTGVGSTVNTQDASVSTVVNRNLAENLPMNGRSFQTLIELTPGVVVTSANAIDQGQFSVNGQRASSNYWTVDGVSANVSASTLASGGLGTAGAVGAFSALGGTNSLVSVDAMQEFRIQTSTFAPEFGRTPGAQISIVTRSGQNAFHGSAFDYVRNDKFDANDWFANNKGISRPQERQNDFGGTFSGPMLKSRSFFFFSYEGLRLRLPQTSLSLVPDITARASAIPAIIPFINAFPLPNGASLGNGVAEFNAGFSDRSSLNAYSLRLDQKVTSKLDLFERYDYSPSSLLQRGGGGNALSVLASNRAQLQTATLGATWAISTSMLNDLRFNYSRANGESSDILDSFGGARPFPSIPYPSSVNATTSRFDIFVSQFSPFSDIGTGPSGKNVQQQFNLVEGFSWQRSSHTLKVGLDFRRLAPTFSRESYSQVAFFDDAPSLAAGDLQQAQVNTFVPHSTLLLRNLSLFAQDTWRANGRLTLTYGLRWDVDFVPHSLEGPQLTAVTGFNLADPSNLALAPQGTPVFQTRFGNVGPRIGAAYALHNRTGRTTVVRGGFGVFYDLASADVGNIFQFFAYPFTAGNQLSGGTFPLSPSDAAPPVIVPPPGNGFVQIGSYDPHLRTPYTLQWNTAIEQQLGGSQTVSATYVGSAGRHLLQQAGLFLPNPNLFSALLESNTAWSDYHALQLQLQRQMSKGLAILGSYTWSHSIDNASAASANGDISNGLVNPLDPNENRGPSSFDIRHSGSVALTYEIPSFRQNHFARVTTEGWSLQSVFQGRSASPIDISDVNFFSLRSFTALGVIRPDVIPGVPVYLFGSGYPGGKALNPAAFTDPPIDPNTGVPTRQGTLSRNALRGFGATQWDISMHRDFSIHEWFRLEFRMEAFNVLNHPNFGPPNNSFGSVGFGLSSEMFGRSLTGSGAGAGGLSPLYQIGGPRSLQLALKLTF